MTQTALTLTHPSRALLRKVGDAVLDLVLHIQASREQAVERAELQPGQDFGLPEAPTGARAGRDARVAVRALTAR